VEYIPGSKSFDIRGDISKKQKEGLENIESFLKKYGGTGVQKVLEKALLDELGLIPIFPVGTEGLTDEKGNVLPDCFLVPEGIKAREFAFHVHSDFGENFLYAVDKRTERRKGADSELKSGDIVQIVCSSKK